MSTIKNRLQQSHGSLVNSLWAFGAERLSPISDGSRQKFGLEHLWIQTKERAVVPFRLNDVQEDYIQQIGWTPDTRLTGLRELILKARQFGFSTLIEALLFLDTINHANTNTVVIAHDLESTEKLFRMVNRFYDRLPPGKPVTQYASKREIYWPSINSRMSIETAGKGTAGRGDTINNLHMSEWAFWEVPEVVTGLLQAVPGSGNIFGESTANGRGNQFHEEYTLAKGKIEQTEDGRTASVFRAHFYAWHQYAGYSIPAPAGFEPNEDEKVLASQYGLTYEQLEWRRRKQLEPGMGSMFPQEYPADDDEAFRVTGNLFFDTFMTEGPSSHVRTAIFTPAKPPPSWYVFMGGLDWGYADPTAFVFGCMDENGNKHVLESFEEARLTNDEQGARVVEIIERWGVPIGKVQILADGNMWSQRTVNGVVVEPDVAAYQRAGLWMLEARTDAVSNKHRMSLLRAAMREPGAFRVQQGFNRDLVTALANAKYDPIKRESVLHDKSSHSTFAAGCFVAHWSTVPKSPINPLSPDEQYADTNREIHEAQRIERMKRNGMQPVRNKDGAIEYNDDGDIVWEEAPRKSKGVVKGFGGR